MCIYFLIRSRSRRGIRKKQAKKEQSTGEWKSAALAAQSNNSTQILICILFTVFITIKYGRFKCVSFADL